MIEHRDFHVIQNAEQLDDLMESVLIFPPHLFDTQGVQALCRYISSEQSQLERVWLRNIMSYELAPEADIFSSVIELTQRCDNCVFYISNPDGTDQIIGASPTTGNNPRNLVAGDRIIVGVYELNDAQVRCLISTTCHFLNLGCWQLRVCMFILCIYVDSCANGWKKAFSTIYRSQLTAHR